MDTNLSEKQKKIVVIIFIITVGIIFMAINLTNDNQKNTKKAVIDNDVITKENIDYKIIKQKDNIYYVAIDEVDISLDDYKEDVKEIITKILQQQKRKDIQIVIYDDRETLLMVDKNILSGKFIELNEKQLSDRGRHKVASFAGKVSNNANIDWKLEFFPNASDSIEAKDLNERVGFRFEGL